MKEVEECRAVGEVCRDKNISSAIFFAWHAKYSGMDVSEAHRLKQFVADQALDIQALKAINAKNGDWASFKPRFAATPLPSP